MDWVVAVPWVGPRDNLDGFLASLDLAADQWQRVRFYDNSPTSEMRSLRLEERGAVVEYHPENLGVGRAWNSALREGHEQTIVCSASVRFERGLAGYLELLERHATEYGMCCQLAWHLCSLGKAAVETVGLIDENFYPAYFEDADYGRRLSLAGIHNGPVEHSPLLPIVQVPAHSAGYGLAVTAHRVPMRFDALLEYYVRKWGNHPNYATYTRPFNDQSNALSYWEPATIDELKARYQHPASG